MFNAGELVEATREGADYLVHRFTLIKSKKACTVIVMRISENG